MNFINNDNNYNLLKLIPKHVAIIMDGNRRWAKQHGQLKIEGYQAGVKSVEKAVKFSIKNKIESLTLYAFSTENWNRPKNEIDSLMELFNLFLNNEINKLNTYNVKLRIIGDISKFHNELQNNIKYAINLTINNTGLQLNIAINYGGRWDITNAIRIIIDKIRNGLLLSEDINEDIVSKFIRLYNQPAVDLVIRTGGECRISNFLLWQIAYSEFYFTNILWPDFNEKNFKEAIISFNQRKRRFGNIKTY